ncbi:uncharacterized protein PADG_02847 [Paracoccidioides brasiliensis Pb18]|uniref:HpcH/HpaI aldolase/citrate lyase domain-containing protein n=1 Tax=Paracoccidioides brasiliensis (strain Pb18) TaxID=502780 RepID=C1G6P2_PARBD|nr:uncharacterized protein PADG_02847 [Paracoccidioides brasiliensis Pb18]EEH46749.2 hypothetical protein PADG_02847 [Paracoccidioides brasiliensis Pb18]
MQAANRLQTALRTGRGVSFGAWQMLPGINHAQIMARSGFDWICIDTEHGNIAGKESMKKENIGTEGILAICDTVKCFFRDGVGYMLLNSADDELFAIIDAQMHESVAAIAATGVSPVVRIVANESWMVKRALDAGAHGIIVPLLYTVEDAKALVESAKFPPVGKRGFGSPFSMTSFGSISQTDYLFQANDALLTIVQIETKEAFENVEEIAKVPGVDVLLVGPWDLGNNIGRPVTGDFHPDLVAAIERIRKAAIGNGKRAGIFCVSGESAKKYAEQGFQMISVIADVTALSTQLTSSLKTARDGL